MKATTNDDFPTVFSKFLSFRQMCGALKTHTQFVFNKDITHHIIST